MKKSEIKVLSGYKEIANFLGVSTRTIFRHIDSIPVSRLGNTIMILEKDLVSWVQREYKSSKNKKDMIAKL